MDIITRHEAATSHLQELVGAAGWSDASQALRALLQVGLLQTGRLTPGRPFLPGALSSPQPTSHSPAVMRMPKWLKSNNNKNNNNIIAPDRVAGACFPPGQVSFVPTPCRSAVFLQCSSKSIESGEASVERHLSFATVPGKPVLRWKHGVCQLGFGILIYRPRQRSDRPLVK